MLNGQQEGAGDLNVIPVMISLFGLKNLRMCKPPEHTLIGRSEGERQATLKIARTMLQNGIDRNTVMKMTGLTEDDWHKSATNPPFLALTAGPSVKTGGAGAPDSGSACQPQRFNSFIIPVTFPVRRTVSGFVCWPLSSKAASRFVRKR
jgi:hypothetical protein